MKAHPFYILMGRATTTSSWIVAVCLELDRAIALYEQCSGELNNAIDTNDLDYLRTDTKLHSYARNSTDGYGRKLSSMYAIYDLVVAYDDPSCTSDYIKGRGYDRVEEYLSGQQKTFLLGRP